MLETYASGGKNRGESVVGQNASLPAQQQILTDLGQMTQALAASGLGSPCVFVVGEVVRLAASSAEGLGGLLEQAQLRRAVGA